MRNRTKYLLGGGVAAVALGVLATFAIGSNPIMIGASFMNMIFSRDNPHGAITVELRHPANLSNQNDVGPGSGDWTSYNRTVTSDRFSPLKQISDANAGQLKVLCSYDTGKLEASQTGILMVGGALIGTTAEDIFSINPQTCHENWRVHENSGLGLFPVNRGAAYLDGKLFRGYPDGYVRAFDAATGKKVWETFIGQKGQKLWFTAAAIAWDGMVYFGTAGGDLHNIRGRMFALNAGTGKPVWQIYTVPRQPGDNVIAKEGAMPFEKMKATWGNPPDVPVSGGGTWTSYTLDPEAGYLYVPIGNPAPDFVQSLRPGGNLFTNTLLVLNAKTGDYVKHYSIMPDDWHDWDMSNAPILYTSRAGHKLLSFHPKDGHLYSYDRADDRQLYRNPVTKQLNATVKFEPGKDVYFCPGSVGGGEWNSAAYDHRSNLVFTGENEWCTTARIKPDEKAARAPDGMVWFGVDYINPYKLAGSQDKPDKWGGWFYATDADSGDWAWRARTNYPIVGAVTPTAGGIVMFGDIGGNFRVLRETDGKVLWDRHFDGAIAGGVITYENAGQQRIAFMSGASHPQWPVEPHAGKVIVLGL